PGSGPRGYGRSPRARARARSGVSSCRRSGQGRPCLLIVLTRESSREKTREIYLVFLLTAFLLRADPGSALTGAAASPPVPRYPLPAPRYLLSVTGGTGTAARPAAARLAQAYSRPPEVTQMQDGRFPFEMVDGVPVVAAPEEIDITNAPELRSALLEAAA